MMKLAWIVAVATFVCIEAQGGADSMNGDVAFQNELNLLMQKHFDLSLTYMFTGYAFGNERVQKPGMSKLLSGLSDSHWEEGIDVLKKHLQRGGSASDVQSSLSFKGKNEIDMSFNKEESVHVTYMDTLVRLKDYSEECAATLNVLYKMNKDGDWTHYFEEKLEKEEELTRELKGHVTNLKQMHQSSIALHAFDSHL